jgi:hypothetical protein
MSRRFCKHLVRRIEREAQTAEGFDVVENHGMMSRVTWDRWTNAPGINVVLQNDCMAALS